MQEEEKRWGMLDKACRLTIIEISYWCVYRREYALNTAKMLIDFECWALEENPECLRLFWKHYVKFLSDAKYQKDLDRLVKAYTTLWQDIVDYHTEMGIDIKKIVEEE